MEYIKSEEANEDLLFREEVMRQFEYFYQYMHGDRKEPNEVETIFKRSIESFGADWIGLIDFDLEVGAWSTRCFYNKRTGSSTETLIEDAENAAQAKRWEQAIRGGKPIVIEDIESIREEAPEEYAMYKRLHVQSVLGVRFLIAFLACNRGKYFPAEYLNTKYKGEKDVSWADLIYKFRMKWKNARNLDDDGLQLILTTEKGYGINPALQVIVDVILAEELMRAIDDASDRLAKIELLRKFHALFQGEFMGTTFTRNSFIRENRLHYKLKYVEKMEVLMKLLIEQGDYNGAAGYCNDILKVYPDCVDIHFWRIVALTNMGDIALIKDIDNNLKEAMDEKMYSYLQRRLQLEFNISEEQLRNEEEQSVVFMRLSDEISKFESNKKE